jgi:hypothetical protein
VRTVDTGLVTASRTTLTLHLTHCSVSLPVRTMSLIRMKLPSVFRQKYSSTATLPSGSPELLSPLTFCLAAVIVVVVVFAIYSPALNFQFILDDHHFLTDPRLQSPGHLWEYFTSYVWAQVPGGPMSFYRPLFALWLRLNFVLCGASPWGWHLLSIVKHVSVAILLAWLAWKLLRDRVAALVAATLFAVHPAQTESVAWVTVPDPLMAAAVLGTLLLYLNYAERVSASRQARVEKSKKNFRKLGRGGSKGSSSAPSSAPSSALSSALWLVSSAAACFAALIAKETAIVLPVAIFALNLIVPFNKTASDGINGFRIRLIGAIRLTLPFLGITVVYLLLRVHALKGQFSSLTQHLPLRTVVLSAPATLWFYLKVMFWPVRPHAFADPTLADALSLRTVLLPGLAVGCAAVIIAAACLWMWKEARRNLPHQEAASVQSALVLGALILVLPILPALNLNALFPGDFLHGRYTYLPLAGLALLLATGWRLLKKGRIAALSAAGVVAIAFCVLTVEQESMWKDDLTVYTVANQNAPHNAPVAQNLSRARVQLALLALDEADGCDEAMPVFQQAIQQYPQDWFAWAGQGECFLKLNKFPQAEQALRRATELSHEPRVQKEWDQVRERMGLPLAQPQ